MTSELRDKIEELKKEIGYDEMSAEQKLNFTKEIREVFADLNSTLDSFKEEVKNNKG